MIKRWIQRFFIGEVKWPLADSFIRTKTYNVSLFIKRAYISVSNPSSTNWLKKNTVWRDIS